MGERAPIKKLVLREEIKNKLAEAIMGGEFKPGDRLIETQIAREYGVSQAPVREAIRDLEQMGLVVTEPYKGTYIREINTEDLKKVYEVRAELEGLAIRLAISRITPEGIAILEDIYHNMLKECDSGDLRTQILLDIKFHEVIIKYSGNDILEKSWSELCIPYWTFLGTSLYRDGNKELVTRHKPILEAIRKKDVDSAVKLIHQHFDELVE